MANVEVVLGPHSLGVTVQLTDDVTIYVGMPPPSDAAQRSEAEVRRDAARRAARLLSLAAEKLNLDT